MANLPGPNNAPIAPPTLAQKAGTQPAPSVRGTLWIVLAEVAFVAMLAMLANQGGDWGRISVLVLVILWFIFIMMHGNSITAFEGRATAGQKVA